MHLCIPPPRINQKCNRKVKKKALFFLVGMAMADSVAFIPNNVATKGHSVVFKCNT